MSSTMKSVMIKTAPDVCNNNMFKAKYVDHNDLLIRYNRSLLRLSRGGRVSSTYVVPNGFVDSRTVRLKPPLRSKTRAQVLAPVSDTAPTTKKVFCQSSKAISDFFFISKLLVTCNFVLVCIAKK